MKVGAVVALTGACLLTGCAGPAGHDLVATDETRCPQEAVLRVQAAVGVSF